VHRGPDQVNIYDKRSDPTYGTGAIVNYAGRSRHREVWKVTNQAALACGPDYPDWASGVADRQLSGHCLIYTSL